MANKVANKVANAAADTVPNNTAREDFERKHGLAGVVRNGDGFVSEFEQFLGGYKAAHPDVEADQLRGWHIWWDRQVEAGEQEMRRKDTVPVKPYPYG